MSFRFVFEFNGEEAAKAKAQRRGIFVIYWHFKLRRVAIPCMDGVATLPYETREDVFALDDLMEKMWQDFLDVQEGVTQQNNLPVA